MHMTLFILGISASAFASDWARLLTVPKLSCPRETLSVFDTAEFSSTMSVATALHKDLQHMERLVALAGRLETLHAHAAHLKQFQRGARSILSQTPQRQLLDGIHFSDSIGTEAELYGALADATRADQPDAERSLERFRKLSVICRHTAYLVRYFHVWRHVWVDEFQLSPDTTYSRWAITLKRGDEEMAQLLRAVNVRTIAHMQEKHASFFREAQKPQPFVLAEWVSRFPSDRLPRHVADALVHLRENAHLLGLGHGPIVPHLLRGLSDEVLSYDASLR